MSGGGGSRPLFLFFLFLSLARLVYSLSPPHLTGPPVAPSWMRTLTMSIGWMMQVAAMPERPPLKNGLAAFHTGLSAMILFLFWFGDVCVFCLLSLSFALCVSLSLQSSMSVGLVGGVRRQRGEVSAGGGGSAARAGEQRASSGLVADRRGAGRSTRVRARAKRHDRDVSQQMRAAGDRGETAGAKERGAGHVKEERGEGRGGVATPSSSSLLTPPAAAADDDDVAEPPA